MEPFIQTSEHYFEISSWTEQDPQLCVGFTTRANGVSQAPYDSFNLGLHVADYHQDVIANREKLANAIGFPLKSWVATEQIHGTEVTEVSHQDKGKGAISHADSLTGKDGLLTREAGILCTAFFADCVPLFFYDPVTKFIGIAHAGWKGTVNRIAEKMIDQFVVQGSKRQHIRVAIGPSISVQHYEVDDYVRQFIPNHLQSSVLITLSKGRYLLDLKQLNSEFLLHNGILRHNIDVTEYDTFHHDALFFSHRRDDGKTGRMLGFIGYRP